MNLYLISQEASYSYYSYNAAVVCAPDEETARNTYPGGGTTMDSNNWLDCDDWCSSPDLVIVQYLGKADESIKQGVVLAAYNAG